MGVGGAAVGPEGVGDEVPAAAAAEAAGAVVEEEEEEEEEVVVVGPAGFWSADGEAAASSVFFSSSGSSWDVGRSTASNGSSDANLSPDNVSISPGAGTAGRVVVGCDAGAVAACFDGTGAAAGFFGFAAAAAAAAAAREAGSWPGSGRGSKVPVTAEDVEEGEEAAAAAAAAVEEEEGPWVV